MRLSVQKFRGEYPIVAARLLPVEMATLTVNGKLQSGDFDGFQDFGNPYALAKSAPIATIWQLTDVNGNRYWMQWMGSELQPGAPNIDAALGTVAGDVTSRFFITGNKYRATTAGPVADSTPQQTNEFYATDPSQQGSNPQFAYPYVTFDVGIDNPVEVPGISAAAVTGLTTNYEFAQPSTINNAVVSNAGGGYPSGAILSLSGGTLSLPAYPARIAVNFVTGTGAIDTSKTGAITLLEGGFYASGAMPSSPAASSSNGAGAGATFNVTAVNSSFSGFNAPSGSNGAGSFVTWTIDPSNAWAVTSGQGDLNVAYSTQSFNLQGAASFIFQFDGLVNTAATGGVTTDLVGYLTGAYNGNTPPGVNIQLVGPAIILSPDDQTFSLYTGITGSNNGSTVTIPPGDSLVAQATGLTIAGNVYYRITAECTASTNSSNPGYSCKATVALASTPTTIIATLNGFIPYSGEQVGVGTNHRRSPTFANAALFENILVAVTLPADNATTESVNYVETYVDSFNDESGPSDPSDTIPVQIDTQATPNVFGPVSITLGPTPASSDVQIRNLYRTVNLGGTAEAYEYVTGLTALTISGATGAFTVGQAVTGGTSGSTGTVIGWSGTTLILSGVATAFSVGETITETDSGVHGAYTASANSTTTIVYSDAVLDENLGSALETQNWVPPPPNMQGILAAPNEIMVGFFANTVCLSVPGHPHAWPVAYQRTTDYPIVADAVRNNDIVILTTGTPYTAFGDDPDPTTGGFSMNREGSAQGCVSKRSVAVHRSYGVIYASTNGLVAYRGQSLIDLIRIQDADGQMKPLFTQQQYQALNPGSIFGVIHDDFYYFWYDTGSKKGGYILDLSPDGFGLVELDFHVTAAFNDPTSGYLFVVPDFSIYNIGGAPVSTPQDTIYQWDYVGSTNKRAKTWARNYWLFNRPMSFNACRVRAADYTDLQLTITNESGSTAWSGAVTSAAAFVIGNIPPGSKWQAALSGVSAVNTIELAEAMEDLLSIQ